MIRILQTVFSTSVISYMLFAFADYMRPGFVTYAFSVHWFFLSTLISGAILLVVIEEAHRARILKRILYMFCMGCFGLLLAIIFWREGEVFGDMRIFVSFIALLLPFIVSRK